MASDQFDHMDIVIEGNSRVGKTKFIERFAEKTFLQSFPHTIGVNFVCSNQREIKVKIDFQDCKLRIWDYVGTERSRNTSNSYYRRAHGVVIAYSITDKLSFSQVTNLANCVQQNMVNAATLIVGMKGDLVREREVSYSEGVQLAESLGVPFLETSARTGVNVDQAFLLLTALIGIKQGLPVRFGISQN